MKYVIRTWLLPLILMSTLSHAKTVLRFQSHIDTKAHTLGDLLQIENDSHHWSRLPLESHPMTGTTLNKEQVLTWMAQRLGNVNATWQGKTHIIISPLERTSGASLLKKAKTTLMNKLGVHYTRIEIKPLSKLSNSEYALDTFQTEMAPSFPTTKRVCVWLLHKNKRIAVWFKVKAYARVWVANRDLPMHTAIQQADFSWKERDIAGITDHPQETLPPHFWLKSPLEHNKILLAGMLQTPPIIRHGQSVSVSVRHHGIVVVMDAIALTDGYLNQTITVKNTRNKQVFVARVRGFQKAEITS